MPFDARGFKRQGLKPVIYLSLGGTAKAGALIQSYF